MSSGRGGRRIGLKLTAFRVGVVVGMAGFLMGAWLLHEWLEPSTSSDFNVDVAVAGADVTRSGGEALVIRNKRGSLIQACRGECDNLRYRGHDDENDYEVRVLDGSGACIACDEPRGVIGGYGAWSHRWVVAGQHPLRILVSDRIGQMAWRPVGEVSSTSTRRSGF